MVAGILDFVILPEDLSEIFKPYVQGRAILPQSRHPREA